MSREIIIQSLPAVNKYRMLVKIPDIMYQTYYDMALGTRDKNRVKTRIFVDVQDWVLDNYPGYGIASMDDFSAVEAEEFKRKTGFDITWGMWLLLEQGVETSLVSSIQSTFKTIDNGNQTDQAKQQKIEFPETR